MKISRLLFVMMLAACGAAGAEGDPCEADEDCEDGLVCHTEDGEDEGECEAEDEDHDHDHDDEDHDHDE